MSPHQSGSFLKINFIVVFKTQFIIIYTELQVKLMDLAKVQTLRGKNGHKHLYLEENILVELLLKALIVASDLEAA